MCDEVKSLLTSEMCKEVKGLLTSETCDEVKGLLTCKPCDEVKGLLTCKPCDEVKGLLTCKPCDEVKGLCPLERDVLMHGLHVITDILQGDHTACCGALIRQFILGHVIQSRHYLTTCIIYIGRLIDTVLTCY